MSIPIYAADAYYQDTLEFYIGGQDYAKEAALWDRYIESRKFTSAPPATDDVKADFRSFISFYTSLKISPFDADQAQPVLQPQSPPDDFYNMYLNGFYGNLSDNVRKDIWNSFLKAHNYTENLQNSLQTVNPPDSTQVRTLFASYIKSLQQQSTQLTTYSHPMSLQQELQRTAVYDTLGALRKYLDATQNLMANQAAVLLLYANWQQEYTKMMQKIPILEGGLPGQLDIGNLLSADKYTFGYGGITLQDVVNWGYKSACESPGNTITFGDSTKRMGAYSFKLNTDSSGNKSVTISFQNPSIPLTSTTIAIKDSTVIVDQTTGQTLDLDVTAADNTIGQGFISMLENITVNGTSFIKLMQYPDASAIVNWLIGQAKANQSDTPVGSEIFSLNSMPIYYGTAFTYSNIPKETNTSKQYSITVNTYAQTYQNDAFVNFHWYGAIVTYKFPNEAETTVYVPARDQLKWYDQNPVTIDGALELARAYISSLLATHITQISGSPIALPGYLLGTTADPTSSTAEYTTVSPEFSGIVKQPVNPTSNLQQREIQARGEAQAALTNYSQTIKGIRDMLGSLATRQQSTLGQAKESLQQQSDIFTAILESIDSVMKAITQK